MTTSQPIPEQLEQVEEEIERYESRSAPWLSFRGSLEQRFDEETGAARTRQLTRFGLAALLLYDAFILGDWLMFPQRLMLAALVRFAIVTPLALILVLIVRRRRSYLWREGSASLLCLVGVASILFLHHNINAAVSIQAGTGFTLVILTANALMQVDPLFAVPVSTAAFLVDLLFLYTDTTLSLPQKLTAGGMVFWITVMTLIANYTLTRERRMSYLLYLRARLGRGILQDVNEELQSLSTTDRLTGVPNRRAYDEKISAAWQIAIAAGRPLSAVMVDVDHFKLLNDTHGHAYGDRILQRIASLLQQSLRGEDDFLARFGGEEFVILLPNTELSVALRVAERMRTMIMVAGAPSGKAGRTAGRGNRWTTISCGVATAFPGSGTRIEQLIESADRAMYEAKRTGRNRVISSEAVVVVENAGTGYVQAS